MTSWAARLPLWFQAPSEPGRVRPVRVDERTGPKRLVLQVVLGSPRYFVPAAAGTIAHQVGEALVPIIMGVAIDRAVATGDLRQLLLWLAVLGADFAMLSFTYRFGARIGIIGILTMQHHLRCAVTDRLLRPRPGQVTAPGAALSLATSDVARVATAASIAIFRTGELAAIVFGGIALLAFAWPIGVAVLLGAPAVILLADRMAAPLHRRSTIEQDAAAAASGRAADVMHGYRVIRGLGAEATATARYRTTSQAALTAALRARSAEGAYVALADLATGLFVTAIGIAAAVAALRGALSVGAFIAVIGLTQFLLSPLQAFALHTGTTWATATGSAQRLLEVLRLPVDERGGGPAATELRADAAVEIDGLVVDDLPALDLRVAPGEIVAIDADGPDAELLVAVLAGLRAPSGGRIRIGDVVVLDTGRAGPVDEPVPGVLVAPHAADLFAGSVRDNVQLPGVDAARAEQALEAAGCADLRTALATGYDSAVGERGTRLSGGQRQRVALARALAQPAALLVLHDPTTSVDTVTEARIAAGLRHRRGPGRLIVVSGSATLHAVADRVVRLRPPSAVQPTAADEC